ncbi:MAG: hypothetical protein J6U38_07090, partial [Clostridia bacterium]|nr:hypothetical protein [Clostridia bacterium]
AGRGSSLFCIFYLAVVRIALGPADQVPGLFKCRKPCRSGIAQEGQTQYHPRQAKKSIAVHIAVILYTFCDQNDIRMLF